MKKAVIIFSIDTDAVYVSLDMDVLDLTIAQVTWIKTRGGLRYREVSYMTQFIGEELSPACLNIIELNPLLDERNQTAELSVEEIRLAWVEVHKVRKESSRIAKNVGLRTLILREPLSYQERDSGDSKNESDNGK